MSINSSKKTCKANKLKLAIALERVQNGVSHTAAPAIGAKVLFGANVRRLFVGMWLAVAGGKAESYAKR